MKEQREASIISVNFQTRFESWAIEDMPTVIRPETITIDVFCDADMDDLAKIYQVAFNAQNQRLYKKIEGARLIWDEEPWTIDSAKAQIIDEVSAEGAICLVAKAKTVTGESLCAGFIICRPVNKAALTIVCGSDTISEAILSSSDSNYPLLLWEDAACLNLANSQGQTVRGVGTKLYTTMAKTADNLKVVSIGRTSPGSFAEKILPKVGFCPTSPLIQDGKDQQRYWLIRKNEK